MNEVFLCVCGGDLTPPLSLGFRLGGGAHILDYKVLLLSRGHL